MRRQHSHTLFLPSRLAHQEIIGGAPTIQTPPSIILTLDIHRPPEKAVQLQKKQTLGSHSKISSQRVHLGWVPSCLNGKTLVSSRPIIPSESLSCSSYTTYSVLTCYLFRPHPEANEVYVTGTFDDWGQTEKLNKVGATFEKEVRLPDASVKILYKVG